MINLPDFLGNQNFPSVYIYFFYEIIMLIDNWSKYDDISELRYIWQVTKDGYYLNINFTKLRTNPDLNSKFGRSCKKRRTYLGILTLHPKSTSGLVNYVMRHKFIFLCCICIISFNGESKTPKLQSRPHRFVTIQTQRSTNLMKRYLITCEVCAIVFIL